MSEQSSLVLGVDAGGTSTRAALFALDGSRVGHGLAGGANAVALGFSAACDNLTSAVRQAVGEAVVGAAVVGLAGNASMRQEVVDQVFRVLGGLEGGVVAVGDVVTAFAAGTASPSGTVLISGTGAIAAKITDHQPVATADGYGWQLGDEGSAFWLGRAAARAVIRALDASAGSGGGRLAELVTCRLLGGGPYDDPVGRLAAVVQERAPLALAELAPLVSEAASAGDPVAVEIVAEAAVRLVRTVSRVHDPGLPIVLAGSVLTSDGPVRESVQGRLREETVRVAGDAAGAAAWLAARAYLSPREAEERHIRFVLTRAQATSSVALP
jgi:glucosamine kinase